MAFGDAEKYTRLYPNSYAAGEFQKPRYDLDSFTPGYLHHDNTLSPFYAQAASASARAARARAKLGSLLPLNTLRVRSPLLLKRGIPPSQVPNQASLPLSRTLRHT